jgi:hypothetical protein
MSTSTPNERICCPYDAAMLRTCSGERDLPSDSADGRRGKSPFSRWTFPPSSSEPTSVGAVLFLRTWAAGSDSLFLTSGSYAAGGLLLLALNGMALLAHELGHALATKHAGRCVPAVGVLLYFGIPSAFVDTTDIWMASRKHRLIATAAHPGPARPHRPRHPQPHLRARRARRRGP